MKGWGIPFWVLRIVPLTVLSFGSRVSSIRLIGKSYTVGWGGGGWKNRWKEVVVSSFPVQLPTFVLKYRSIVWLCRQKTFLHGLNGMSFIRIETLNEINLSFPIKLFEYRYASLGQVFHDVLIRITYTLFTLYSVHSVEWIWRERR